MDWLIAVVAGVQESSPRVECFEHTGVETGNGFETGRWHIGGFSEYPVGRILQRFGKRSRGAAEEFGDVCGSAAEAPEDQQWLLPLNGQSGFFKGSGHPATGAFLKPSEDDSKVGTFGGSGPEYSGGIGSVTQLTGVVQFSDDRGGGQSGRVDGLEAADSGQ